MKRAFLVLGSYLLGGFVLLFLSSFFPGYSVFGQWCWFLGLLGIAVPGFILIGFILILPHELAHIYVGKRLGFGFGYIKILGFSLQKYLGRNVYRWDFSFYPPVHRILYKSTATVQEVQKVLIAGPIASLGMAALFSPFLFFDVTNHFGIIAVGANALYAIGSVIGSRDNPTDGTHLRQAFKNPESVPRMIEKHYQEYGEWSRLRRGDMSSYQMKGEPAYDVQYCLSYYWVLMDGGKVDEAEPYLRKGLEIVIAHPQKGRSFVECVYEAAIYFRRFKPDEELARKADELCEKLGPDHEKKQIVEGAKLWVAGDRAAAIEQWESFHEEWNKKVTDPGTFFHGRDWFLRLRTEDMVFETDRLFARLWRPEDIASSFEIYRNPEVVKYLGREPKPVATIEEMTGIIERRLEAQKEWKPGKGFWALVRKEDEKLIGAIMGKFLPDGEGNLTSDVEIGWHLGQDFWGSGYATEAAKAVAEYGFKTDPVLNRLVAVIYDANEPSKKVARKIGMKHIGKSSAYYGVELEVFELKRT